MLKAWFIYIHGILLVGPGWPLCCLVPSKAAAALSCFFHQDVCNLKLILSR